MPTKSKRTTRQYPRSVGNLALADESLGVLYIPKAKPLSVVLGVAPGMTEEVSEVTALAPVNGNYCWSWPVSHAVVSYHSRHVLGSTTPLRN